MYIIYYTYLLLVALLYVVCGSMRSGL